MFNIRKENKSLTLKLLFKKVCLCEQNFSKK